MILLEKIRYGGICLWTMGPVSIQSSDPTLNMLRLQSPVRQAGLLSGGRCPRFSRAKASRAAVQPGNIECWCGVFECWSYSFLGPSSYFLGLVRGLATDTSWNGTAGSRTSDFEHMCWQGYSALSQNLRGAPRKGCWQTSIGWTRHCRDAFKSMDGVPVCKGNGIQTLKTSFQDFLASFSRSKGKARQIWGFSSDESYESEILYHSDLITSWQILADLGRSWQILAGWRWAPSIAAGHAAAACPWRLSAKQRGGHWGCGRTWLWYLGVSWKPAVRLGCCSIVKWDLRVCGEAHEGEWGCSGEERVGAIISSHIRTRTHISVILCVYIRVSFCFFFFLHVLPTKFSTSSALVTILCGFVHRSVALCVFVSIHRRLIKVRWTLAQWPPQHWWSIFWKMAWWSTGRIEN